MAPKKTQTTGRITKNPNRTPATIRSVLRFLAICSGLGGVVGTTGTTVVPTTVLVSPITSIFPAEERVIVTVGSFFRSHHSSQSSRGRPAINQRTAPRETKTNHI